MQRNILWKGLDADTTENCAVNFLGDSIVVRSEIEGWNEGKAISAEYMIKMNQEWIVAEFEITTLINGEVHNIKMARNAKGEWQDNLGIRQEFNDCSYIDITLTPLTNTLPVNGLKLLESQEKEITVVYIDIMANEIRLDSQRYRRTGRLTYRFENDGGNFRADINVDEQGFVTDYPQLFETV